MACSTTGEVLEKVLIEQVQRRPYLFDMKMESYKNMEKKEQAWEDIRNEMTDMGFNTINTQTLKARWKTLRDYFSRKLKEDKDANSSYVGTKWVHFEAMQFLEPHLKKKTSIGFFPSRKPSSRSHHHLPKPVVNPAIRTITAANGDSLIIQEIECGPAASGFISDIHDHQYVISDEITVHGDTVVETIAGDDTVQQQNPAGDDKKRKYSEEKELDATKSLVASLNASTDVIRQVTATILAPNQSTAFGNFVATSLEMLDENTRNLKMRQIMEVLCPQ